MMELCFVDIWCSLVLPVWGGEVENLSLPSLKTLNRQ